MRHGGEGFSVRMTEAWGKDHSVGLGHRDAWRRGDWNHVVVAWDQNFGLRSYLNGKPAEKATWGRDAWDDNAHGVEISLGSVRHRACRSAFWLDELYIFSVPLTEQEAADLHDGRTQNVGVRETPSRLTPSDVTRRLKSAGIDENAHLPLLAATPARLRERVCVRALRARTAKQQTTTVRFALDGLEGTFWPYPYLRGTTLDVFLEEPTALNYIEFTGLGRPFRAFAKQSDHAPNRREGRAHHVLPEEVRVGGHGPPYTADGSREALLLAESKDGDLICRRRLDQTIRSDVIRFETSVHDRFHLSEIRLAEIGRTPATPRPGDRVLTLAHMAKLEDFGYLKRGPLDMWKRRFHQYVCFGQEIGFMARHIAGVCAMGDRNLLVAEPGDGGPAQALDVAPLQQAQIFSPDFGKQTPVDTMTLRLRVSGLAEEDVLRLRVRQPCDVYRNLLKMDFRVKNPAGPGEAVWIELTADVPDQVILPGERWWVEVALAKGATVHYGRGGSQVVLSCPDAAKSRREFVADQIKLIHSHYRADSEPHPWDSFSWTVTGRRFRFTSESLYLAMRAALAVDPTNEIALTYWHRTHYTFPDRKLDLKPEDAPEWALLQRELLRGITRIIHWWIDNRQMPDGNLGGGWGDDVETASNWPCVALISNDEKVKRSLERIADGVWNNPKEVDPLVGYAVRSMDVEHAAEPTTCSQPHMMLLRYGEPEFIERNMRTAHSVGNLWLGVNPKGERLFRSYMYNARRLSVAGYHACDVPYNSVPMRAVNYIAWYNRNPSALQWAREWTETWLSKCMNTDDGKPAGVVPLEIVFATGRISGFSGHWSKSVYRGGVTGVLHQFLSAYCLTGDRKFLDYLIKYGRYRTDFCRTLVGGPQWPTVEQQAERNDRMRASLKNLLDTELLVTWAEPSTDRIRLPGLGDMSQGYLGHGPFRGAYPTMAASYEGGGEDFCAQVLDNTPTRLRIWLYNFKTTPLRMAARVWFLQAGDYRVQLGPDANSDGRPDRVTRTEELPLERYSRIDLELPPRQQVVLTADQLRPRERIGPRADLGIGPRDLRYDAKSSTLHVTVHNVGARDAENVCVRLLAAGGSPLGEAILETLPAPLDMQPKTRTIAFKMPPAEARKGCAVVLDPDGQTPEITEVNNRIERGAGAP